MRGLGGSRADDGRHLAPGRGKAAGQAQTGRAGAGCSWHGTCGPAAGRCPVSGGTGPARASLADIRAARRQLGGELIRLREAARFSQTDLARKMACARSTLSASEHGHSLGSQQLWQRIDDLLGAGGALVRRRDEVAAMTTMAADDLVAEGLRAPGGRPPAGTVSGRERDPITAVRACPGCGKRLTLRLELRAMRLVESRPAAAMGLTRAAGPGRSPGGPGAARAEHAARPGPRGRSRRGRAALR